MAEGPKGPWEDYAPAAAPAGPPGPWNDFAPAVVAADARRAKSISDAVVAGFQNSATGLALRGELPEQQLGEDAPWYHRLAAGAAGLAADLPLSIAGAVGGAVAGAAVTGPAAPAGAVVGGGAGAFAAPMALREALIEAYSNNHAASWAGVWEIAKAAILGGTKGAVIGGATLGAGRIVAPILAPAGRIATGVGAAGTELAALTATSAAVEGHMPTWQDFMDNAILLGGAKGAMHVAKGLRAVYVETGRRPEQVVADAARNPEVLKQLVETQEMPEAYRALALEERAKAAFDQDKRPEAVAEMLRQAADPGAPINREPVRYEYITDEPTAQLVVRAVAEAYKADVELQRRGTVPTEKSFADGVRLAEEGKLDPRKVGAGANDAELVARATLTKGAAERARKIADELAAKPEEQVTLQDKLKFAAAMEQVGMFYGELAGAGAEVGRALRMLREIKRNPDRLGDAEALIKLYEGRGRFTDLAQLARAMKDPEQMRKFAEDLQKATKMEMVIEGWKAAILSGPQTHLANVLGNSIKWAVEIPETALAATLEATRRAIKGDPMSLALYKAKALSPLYGVRFGAKDALTIAAEVWKQKGEHLEKADVFKSAIPGKAGEIIRTPFRALQVEDALFRTFAERAKSYELAVERAGKEGFGPGTREFNEAVVRYTEKPQLGLTKEDAQAVTKLIEEHGAESVFAQRLGPRWEMIQRAMAGHPMQFVIPFVRTPVNLVSWAMQHTPGMNLMSARWLKDFNAGGTQRDRALSRIAIGTGLALIAIDMAEDGMVTGSGLLEKELRGTKKGAGEQPYSIKLGNKYYSYQRMEPVAKVLSMAVDLVDLMKASKDIEDKGKIAAMVALLFGNATISTTYLSGLAGAMNAVVDPERYGEGFLEGYATSLIPKIVGQTVAMKDPHQREVDGVMEAIQSQLPYFREKLMPKRDVWGEPVANNKWFSVMPVQMTEASQDKVKTEAVRLQVAIVDAPKSITERGPFKPGEQRIELTAEQRDIMRQVSGKNAMALLSPIVNSQDWERIPDFAKAEVYRRIFEGTRKQGRYAALPPDEASRVKLREKIVEEIIRQQQEVSGK